MGAKQDERKTTACRREGDKKQRLLEKPFHGLVRGEGRGSIYLKTKKDSSIPQIWKALSRTAARTKKKTGARSEGRAQSI